MGFVTDSRLSAAATQRLRCPACHGGLEPAGAELLCRAESCRRRFPVIDGVPVLIDDGRSLFETADFESRRDTTFHLRPGRKERVFNSLLRLAPTISSSRDSGPNYRRFAELLLLQAPRPRVLVVGGSIQGRGMDALVDNPAFDLVASDVSFGPLTALICDAHEVPFENETFDGVIVQAVLEHVLDPWRCVDEIHRVLKSDGLVYAETPFMQQVHMGPYDFTRFTHSGHRRLFRRFGEIASGPIGGPGMALAWSYQYFLLSLSTWRPLRGVFRAFAGATAFFLKYADRYLVQNAGAVDAASGFFFMGRKQTDVLSDRDLIRYYRGAISG